MTATEEVPDVLAMDLGGTQLRTAIFSGSGQLERWSVPTPKGAAAVINEMVHHIDRAQKLAKGHLRAVGISALGPVDPVTGAIRDAPNIGVFDPFPLRQLLQERVALPIEIINDANAATISEWHLGSGRGTRDFCYVTISTGIGCGIIAGGQLITGRHGAAGNSAGSSSGHQVNWQPAHSKTMPREPPSPHTPPNFWARQPPPASRQRQRANPSPPGS